MKKRHTKHIGLSTLTIFFWVVILLSVFKMATIAYPYFVPPFPTDIDFLMSKQWLVDNGYWMTAFYIHISSSVVVIAAGISQFSRYFLAKYPLIHRKVGKVYVALILFVAAPSGLFMAFYGNGGWLARYAFIIQALLWWGFSFKAYHTIINKNVEGHCRFMIRSYALTLSAISLRAATYLVSYWKLKEGIDCPNPDYTLICYPTFYVLLAWMSWIINLLIAEVLLWAGIVGYYIPLQKLDK